MEYRVSPFSTISRPAGCTASALAAPPAAPPPSAVHRAEQWSEHSAGTPSPHQQLRAASSSSCADLSCPPMLRCAQRSPRAASVWPTHSSLRCPTPPASPPRWRTAGRRWALGAGRRGEGCRGPRAAGGLWSHRVAAFAPLWALPSIPPSPPLPAGCASLALLLAACRSRAPALLRPPAPASALCLPCCSPRCADRVAAGHAAAADLHPVPGAGQGGAHRQGAPAFCCPTGKNYFGFCSAPYSTHRQGACSRRRRGPHLSPSSIPAWLPGALRAYALRGEAGSEPQRRLWAQACALSPRAPGRRLGMWGPAGSLARVLSHPATASPSRWESVCCAR